MMKRALASGFLAIGILAAGPLAWAGDAASGAAGEDPDRPAPPIQFLIDKDAFVLPGAPAETVRTDLLSRFSVRLYGGYGYAGEADVNAGSRGFIELLEAYGNLGLGAFNGGYNPVHGGLDAGIDLVYQVTPAIGIGLGAGFIRHTRYSEASLLGASYNMITRIRPTVSAVPVRLGAFYTIPIAARVDLTAELGGAYYAGLEFDLERYRDNLSGDWEEVLISGGEAGSSKFGVHGGLGLEYKLSARLGVFVQAAGRYAKLGNFGTASAAVNDEAGGGTMDGKLYLRTSIGSLGANSSFLVYAAPPAGDEDTIYREPKFDLSGFSLQAGIRIRL